MSRLDFWLNKVPAELFFQSSRESEFSVFPAAKYLTEKQNLFPYFPAKIWQTLLKSILRTFRGIVEFHKEKR